jgi:hypothetical protein
VRDFVVRTFVNEARRKSLRSFSVNAGEVHKAMGLQNRVPQVCHVLQSAKFLRESGLRIVEKKGPPSGLSTSVTITYEFQDNGEEGTLRDDSLFYALRGIGRELFAKYGGGEAYLRSEREGWNDEREGGSE